MYYFGGEELGRRDHGRIAVGLRVRKSWCRRRSANGWNDILCHLGASEEPQYYRRRVLKGQATDVFYESPRGTLGVPARDIRPFLQSAHSISDARSL